MEWARCASRRQAGSKRNRFAGSGSRMRRRSWDIARGQVGLLGLLYSLIKVRLEEECIHVCCWTEKHKIRAEQALPKDNGRNLHQGGLRKSWCTFFTAGCHILFSTVPTSHPPLSWFLKWRSCSRFAVLGRLNDSRTSTKENAITVSCFGKPHFQSVPRRKGHRRLRVRTRIYF